MDSGAFLALQNKLVNQKNGLRDRLQIQKGYGMMIDSQSRASD